MGKTSSKFLLIFKYIPSCSSGELKPVVASGYAAQEGGGTIPGPDHTFNRRNKP